MRLSYWRANFGDRVDHIKSFGCDASSAGGESHPEVDVILAPFFKDDITKVVGNCCKKVVC